MGRREGLICLALLAAVGLVFGQAIGHGFVGFDDPQYVSRHPRVAQGLSLENAHWAFTAFRKSAWHPLTWLSHMLDADLYGMRPGGHHLTSVLLHGLNSALVFLVLRRLTGATWRSALVAALFALHPLRVESVAWISERKGVLSTTFWWLALWAYADYARTGSRGRYGLVVGFTAAGLLCKSMLVTLPLVMLLLDAWPLRRPLSWRIVAEKLPLLALSAVASLLSLAAQRAGGGLAGLEPVPLGARVANAAVSYLAYVGKALWPVGLAPYYPLRGMPPAWLTALAVAFLLVASALALRSARARPWLAVGWGWYVVALVPVLGIAELGRHAMADRYSYVPLTGLFLAFAWGLGDVARSRSLEPRGVALAVCGLLAALGWASWHQVARWKDSVTLFSYAAGVTPGDPTTLTNLGLALMEQGRFEEAEMRLREVIALEPGEARHPYNLASVLVLRGRTEEATLALREAARLDPARAEFHNSLGVALLRSGRFEQAGASFEVALRLRPRFAEAHYNLAQSMLGRGLLDDAIREYEAALRLRPDLAQARAGLQEARARQERQARP